MHVNTMSTSLGEALSFVTLALGGAIKQEFIYIPYFKKIILSAFMSLIQEHLLSKLRLLMKWTRYAYKCKYGYVDRGITM